jgi:hypothetical protein
MSRDPRRTPSEFTYSSLRWTVSLDAEVCEPLSCFLPLRIIDLSLSGCRVWAGYRLTTGRAVRIAIPGLAPIRATTIHAEQGYASFHFDTPLHPAILRHLVDGNPPPLRSATGEDP